MSSWQSLVSWPNLYCRTVPCHTASLGSGKHLLYGKRLTCWINSSVSPYCLGLAECLRSKFQPSPWCGKVAEVWMLCFYLHSPSLHPWWLPNKALSHSKVSSEVFSLPWDYFFVVFLFANNSSKANHLLKKSWILSDLFSLKTKEKALALKQFEFLLDLI